MTAPNVETHKISIDDVVLNADGTITISNKELHKAISSTLSNPVVVDGPPLGPGTPGHPIQPSPTKPIIVITF